MQTSRINSANTKEYDNEVGPPPVVFQTYEFSRFQFLSEANLRTRGVIVDIIDKDVWIC